MVTENARNRTTTVKHGRPPIIQCGYLVVTDCNDMMPSSHMEPTAPSTSGTCQIDLQNVARLGHTFNLAVSKTWYYKD